VIFPADGPRWEHSQRGLNRENHLPLPPMLPGGTLGDRDFPLRRRREGTAATDPGHSRTDGRPRFFRPWPGWRQV